MLSLICYFKVKMQYLLWRNCHKISISELNSSLRHIFVTQVFTGQRCLICGTNSVWSPGQQFQQQFFFMSTQKPKRGYTKSKNNLLTLFLPMPLNRLPWFSSRRNHGIGNFVGSVISLNNSIPFTNEYQCPEACRPKNHTDWLYC